MTNQKKLDIINENLQQCVNMFNCLLQDVNNILLKEFSNKDQMLKTYSNILSEIILKTPIEPISGFIINIYSNDIYRKHLSEGNDLFFRNNNYSSLTNGNNKKNQMIDQIKIYWPQLSLEKQNYIKHVLKTMINISEQYIINKDDGNIIIKEMYEITQLQNKKITLNKQK